MQMKMQMQRADWMLIGVHCLDQKMSIPLTCWRMATQQQQWIQLKQSTKIDSPGKNKEKGMAEAHTDADVQNPTLKQHGDNTKTQKTRQFKIQFSTVTGNNNEKKITKTTKRYKSTKIWEI